MKTHRPYGLAPTTLESEILKLRAFEMMLVLFYIEDLKKFIIECFEVAHKVDSNIPMLPARRKLEFANNFLIRHTWLIYWEQSRYRSCEQHARCSH